MKFQRQFAVTIFAAVWVLATHLPSVAAPWRVTIDTAALQGTSGFIAIDLIAGSPDAGNAASISALFTNAVFSGASSSGDVTGSLQPGPLTLGSGAALFSNWLQGVTSFSTSLVFDLELGDAVVAGGRPDQFSFFLLDGNLLPYETADPTAANALFAIDLAGVATRPQAFSSAFATARIDPLVGGGGGGAVPLPGTPSLVLLAAALMGLTTWRWRPRAAGSARNSGATG